MAVRRSTLQRKMLLEELQHRHPHATAAELYQIVRQTVPRLSLGTVYRNLDILHQEGLVRKLEYAGRETRFDAILDEHYHLHCTRCGKIEDTDVPVAVNIEGDITRSGWDLKPPRIEFPGLCPACKALPDGVSRPGNVLEQPTTN